MRVVLFMRLSDGVRLDTSHHVPAKVDQMAGIPRTKGGKIIELAVRSVVHGEPLKNVESLANPEAQVMFENLPELRE